MKPGRNEEVGRHGEAGRHGEEAVKHAKEVGRRGEESVRHEEEVGGSASGDESEVWTDHISMYFKKTQASSSQEKIPTAQANEKLQ